MRLTIVAKQRKVQVCAESARMNITEAQSSCWADLQLDILVKAFAHLPLKDGFSCEKVCTVWRRALLSGPVAGQNKAKTLVLSHAVGSSLIHGDSSGSVAELNISWPRKVVVKEGFRFRHHVFWHRLSTSESQS